MTILYVAVMIFAGLSGMLALSIFLLMVRWVRVVRVQDGRQGESDAIVRELDYPDSPDPEPTRSANGWRYDFGRPRDPALDYCPVCAVRARYPVPNRGIPRLCEFHARRIGARKEVFA